MVTGKMMDQGPALVITFQVFMLHMVKNKEGKVIEGDPVNYLILAFLMETIFSAQSNSSSPCLGTLSRYGGIQSSDRLEIVGIARAKGKFSALN